MSTLTGSRAAGMQRRRARILEEARRIIAVEGIDALNTRALARAADLSQPTLYNLIGTKTDILKALMADSINRIESSLDPLDTSHPLEMAHAVIDQAVALFSADEIFLSSTYLIVNHLQQFGDAQDISDAFRQSVNAAIRTCHAALEAGHLHGNLSSESIATQMFTAFRVGLQDWASGYIDAQVFRRRVLRGFYFALATDAEDGFRAQLVAMIKEFEPHGPPA